jgi:uncharacterized protein
MKFGVAFCEASGRLPHPRRRQRRAKLKPLAARNARGGRRRPHLRRLPEATASRSTCLGRIKDVPEVVGLFCATANPVEVVIAETAQGRGVLGVIDGAKHAEGRRRAQPVSNGATRSSAKIGYKR